METQAILVANRPKFNMGWPAWWHHRGVKVRVANQGNIRLTKQALLLEGSAVRMKVQQFIDHNLWRVGWEAKHASGGTSGYVHLDPIELEAAFGIREYIGEGGEQLAILPGCSSASQGKFIRYERWLNIPCPGTGMDGDPNVSIEVTREITEAIRELMANQ